MSQKVTIGGNRVGSGKKMQAELHDFYRSTHNLSETFNSSMASGVLYPALCKIAMRGDTFDIDLSADCRTIPTVGPLFGSYKMQVDVYQCPIRLYQGILHNNPLAIGLNMSQVKFPILRILNTSEGNFKEDGAFNTSSLLKYLGMSGLGHSANQQTTTNYGRDINALPALSYYDIFKTYYANKQEENAYVITPGNIRPIETKILRWYDLGGAHPSQEWSSLIIWADRQNEVVLDIYTENAEIIEDEININMTFRPTTGTTQTIVISDETYWSYKAIDQNHIQVTITPGGIEDLISEYGTETDTNFLLTLSVNEETTKEQLTSDIQLRAFTLSNIDDMRYDLLGSHQLGTAFTIEADGDGDYFPYRALIKRDDNTGKTWNKFTMNGLVLKTYQNDIFNNWLNTEWIEGENGINELTKVAIVDGAFSMDALNMSMKLYNMLNRIALAGGTYEDWQDVVYEEVQRRQIESPIYVGGMSQEVMFDEIIQNAPTEGNPLGTLGGRGKLYGQKRGGKIHVKCDEACFIIAIVSLTPRIMYYQGNEFYMTDVFSMDDLHKPAMDGIGFQDLIGERMAYWDTVVTPGTTSVLHRSKIGKLPAWIEYMTSYDKAYGDFAGGDKAFMVLSRDYEKTDTLTIKDATTYIDPSKYNYAFAVTELAAQNFWVQVHFDIKARRLMSARLIPNV